MWSSALLPFLVGLVAASNSAWKSDTQYVYKVSGRTLTGFTDVSAEYTGILLKATLTVQLKKDGSSLIGQVSDGQYAQVVEKLPDGWRSPVNSGDANYKPIPWSGKPFEIRMEHGLVKDLIVDADVPQWEGNMLKGIVSQIQVDTEPYCLIKSNINQLPEEGSNSAIYKTMEETVTGRYETLYEVNPLPEYAVQMEPELVPFEPMKGEGLIEILKTKNFSNAEQRSGYYYGLGEMPDVNPLSSEVGDIMSRSSISRIVLSGNLNRYTIQSSVTTNKISVAPVLMNNHQKGMVVSRMHMSLANMQPSSNDPQGPSNPKSLGGLIYTYEGRAIAKRPSRPGDKYASYNYDKSDEQSSSSRGESHESKRSSSEEDNDKDNVYGKDIKPSLDEPPFSPILPYYKNYEGRAIKAARIATEIGQELQDPHQIQEKHSLSKYVILTTIIRTLNDKEIEQVAEGLYTNEDRSANGDAWKAFRDAVVGSGTGPALITIQRWILNGKIKGDAAAEAISGLTQSVREPTDEFIRFLYKFVTRPEVKSQAKLNVTAILSLSELISEVYINKHYSDNAYPVEIFGTFHTRTGRLFVLFEYIPYLADQLRKAVAEGDSHKIQVYISALGLVGHPAILFAFEPYLEGIRQVSQFQRLHMVCSLERLVTNYPRFARYVLYKLYQNPRENQDVRIAAVYQILRTGPSATMLQRMAEYTNIDTNEQVNAAVKSIIKHIAHFNSSAYTYTRYSAKSAEKHLINRIYGPQYSHSHKDSYGKQEQSLFQYIGSPDSYLPKAFRLAYRYNYGGYRKQYLNIQTSVSSVSEVMRILKEQVKEYLEERVKQEQNALEGVNKWSSEGVAKTLKIQVDEREQAEGNLIFKLGGYKRFFTLDNHTIEALPEMVKEMEQALRDGKPFRYTRFVNRYELEISYPTEMALPFVYSFDIPTVLSLDGSTKMSAQPEISDGSKLNIPDTIRTEGDLHFLLSLKVQGRLGFFTPCDHEQYVAAYEKDTQIYLPIKHNLNVNLKAKEVEGQVSFQKPERKTQLAYYKSTPYISHFDILQLHPAISNPSTRIVGPSPQNYYNTVFGEKSTGMAFRFDYAGDDKYLDFRWLYDQLQYAKNYASFVALWESQNIGSRKLSLEYAGDISQKNHVRARFVYGCQNIDAPQTQNVDMQQLYEAPADPKERLEDFAKKACAGIPSASVVGVHTNFKFEGQGKPIDYNGAVTYARSNVEDTSRVLLHWSKGPELGAFRFAAMIKNHFPALSEMDPEKLLSSDVSSTIQASAVFGYDFKSGTQVNGHVKLRRSGDRTQYLRDSHEYHKCQKEMQNGNKQLFACQQVTQEAKYPDSISTKWQYQNMDPQVQNFTANAYSWYRYFNFYNSKENFANGGHGKQDEVNMDVGFAPDFSAVNTSFGCEKYEALYENIRLDFLSSGEETPIRYWLASPVSQINYYRPICVVDKSGVNTYDNFTYHAKLSNQWTVMMVHTPLHARYSGHTHKDLSEYMNSQDNYAIFVKQSGGDQKQVKVYLRTPQTESQKAEIDFKPSGGQYPTVLVDNQPQRYSEKQVAASYDKYIQLYGLPNGEARLDVAGEFSLIYDGSRVKVRLNNDRYYNAVRGLCGNANTMAADDLRAPENCALRTPEELIEAYTVPDDASPNNPKNNHYKKGCYAYRYVYANVIPYIEMEQQPSGSVSSNQLYGGRKGPKACTKQQTRYVVDGDNVCFTIKPLPKCQASCGATQMISKSVPVHCVTKSNVSQMWMTQIDKGASPDFGLKSVTKSLNFDVPQTCRQS